MAMKPVSDNADVGVVVGRFQVHQLHEAHSELLDYVNGLHDKLIIVLGLSRCRVTFNNPLDFESRKHMLRQAYPHALIMYVHDSACDDVWSKNLDKVIADTVSPHAKVMLYGGRDAFIKHYDGRYKTTEFEQHASYVSGKQVRKKLANISKASIDFRAGVIYAAMNQYPKAIPTVDVAIWQNHDHKKLLLARKPEETLYRFVGGFASGGSTYEADARREVFEETHLEITDPAYVGSHKVDDWRYRSEVDSIVTLLYEAEMMFGKPVPDDDIAELKWFDIKTLLPERLVEEHRPLLQMLLCKRENHHGQHLHADG